MVSSITEVPLSTHVSRETLGAAFNVDVKERAEGRLYE